MYWKWAGFKSGFRVRFKEPKSSVKRIMPVRVTSEETQRQKVKKGGRGTDAHRGTLQGRVAEEADRNVDLTYASYKDEFNRMQGCITDGLLYCMKKSDGKLKHQVDELSRQNEILCADIAYIHKTGVGYGLENAKRQQAYEEAKGEDGGTGGPYRPSVRGGSYALLGHLQTKTEYESIMYTSDYRPAGHRREP